MPDKKYFQSVKRGEVADLRAELNSPNREKQKEVFAILQSTLFVF